MKKRLSMALVLVVFVSLFTSGCSSRSGDAGSGLNPVAAVTDPTPAAAVSVAPNFLKIAAAQADGTAVVKLDALVSGVTTLGLQVRIAGVPAGFAPTLALATKGGKTVSLTKAAIPFDGVVLCQAGIEIIDTVADVDVLTFSQPLPTGAVVTVYDADRPVAAGTNTGIRADYGFGPRLRMEFTGDGFVSTKDIVLAMAWISTYRSTDQYTVLTRAHEMFSLMAPGDLAFIPTDMVDDLTGDFQVGMEDIVLTIAWMQLGRPSGLTEYGSVISARALEIYPGFPLALTQLPGTSYGLSTVALPTTISGRESLGLVVWVTPSDGNWSYYLQNASLTVSLMSTTGTPIQLRYSPALSGQYYVGGNHLALVSNDVTPQVIADFSSLTFSAPLPVGTQIDVADMSTSMPSLLTTVTVSN